jgi:acetyl esterase/lipase
LRRGSLFSCFSTDNFATATQFETIMIFMAGGGFVSLSSETAQAFTRKWSNSLKIPIFCIDYRKAPDHRFPTLIDDCLLAYRFIINNIHNYFNVRPRKVILAGDSSGGNLALALHALLLQHKFPLLPTAMFLAYPAADLRPRFSPSRVYSFRDPLLQPTLLMLCLEEDLGQ